MVTQEQKEEIMKKGKKSGQQVLDRLQFLLIHSGQANLRKPVIVFGPTPGVVTEVTVNMAGSIVLEYRALTPAEMGNPKPKKSKCLDFPRVPCGNETQDEAAFRQLVNNLSPKAVVPRGFDLWSEPLQEAWLKQHQKKTQ
jgi:hypothetical protein